MPPRLAQPNVKALRRALGCGLLAATIAACAGNPTRNGNLRPSAGPAATASTKPASAAPSQAPASADPQATASLPKPEASATPATPLLPLRLGLALPASLVGAAAQSRLVGSKAQDALVAPEGSTLVALADGRILSNHAAGLISDHGGGLISDHGGGLISDHGGGLIANNGGGLIANNGGGFRLAQAEAGASAPLAQSTGGGPTYLWLVLAMLDQQDQLLQAFAQAGPSVGQWKRFGAEGAKLLPPPESASNYALAIASIDAELRQQRYAGVLTQEADGPHLRMLWLPSATAPLADGRPIMDFAASGADQAMRSRFVPPLESVFGMAESAARFTFGRGPLGAVVDGQVGERYLPYEQQGPVAKAINGVSGHTANRRRLLLAAQSLTRSVAIVARGMIHPGTPPFQRRDLYAFGFASPGQADAGLAFLRRVSTGVVGQAAPFVWIGPDDVGVDGAASPAPAHFYLPSGQLTSSPSAVLQGLVPSLPNPVDRDVPAAVAPGEDPSQDPTLRIPAWPTTLMGLPDPS